MQLGSPHVTKDSAASLVVLSGQAAKTIAEQQKVVADAHAANAAEEAEAAQLITDLAQGDAKAAERVPAGWIVEIRRVPRLPVPHEHRCSAWSRGLMEAPLDGVRF